MNASILQREHVIMMGMGMDFFLEWKWLEYNLGRITIFATLQTWNLVQMTGVDIKHHQFVALCSKYNLFVTKPLTTKHLRNQLKVSISSLSSYTIKETSTTLGHGH